MGWQQLDEFWCVVSVFVNCYEIVVFGINENQCLIIEFFNSYVFWFGVFFGGVFGWVVIVGYIQMFYVIVVVIKYVFGFVLDGEVV